MEHWQRTERDLSGGAFDFDERLLGYAEKLVTDKTEPYGPMEQRLKRMERRWRATQVWLLGLSVGVIVTVITVAFTLHTVNPLAGMLYWLLGLWVTILLILYSFFVLLSKERKGSL